MHLLGALDFEPQPATSKLVAKNQRALLLLVIQQPPALSEAAASPEPR
jgi:hypothetical protein